MNLSGWRRWLSFVTEPRVPWRPDDQGDGPGVPVPVGPRPRRGGAQARPPGPERDTEPVRPNS